MQAPLAAPAAGTGGAPTPGESGRLIGAGRAVVIAAGIVLAGLLVAITLSPAWLVYDERFYQEIAHLLRGGAGFFEMMRAPTDIAAGPLYGYVHLAAAPLTDLRPPAIRYVNVVLLLVAVAALRDCIAQLGYSQPTARAVMLAAVPMVATVTGLALTEVPSLALMSLSAALFVRMIRASEGHRWLLAAVAGLCAGGAVLGRQTYLPVAGVFVVLALYDRRWAGPAVVALMGMAAALGPMLIAWHGIAPPWIVDDFAKVVPLHGIMAFIYLGVCIVFVAPRFLLEAFDTAPMRRVAVACIAAAVAIAAIGVVDLPVATRLLDLVPAVLRSGARVALQGAVLSIALLALAASLRQLWLRRADRAFLMAGAVTMLMAGTAAGIGAQFSSRYVLAAFPFAILFLQPWVRPGFWAAARLLLGSAVGLASLWSYYWRDIGDASDIVWRAPPELLDKMPLREWQARKR